MSAPQKATGGRSKRAASKSKLTGGSSTSQGEISPLSSGRNVHSSADRPPRGRSAGDPSQGKLPKPPQGHSGFKRKVARKPPRASGPPRYETTNAKERIISSAVEIAEERGYESLRITDITDPLGIQRQAFYSHFKDKRHCLCAAMDPKLGAIVELAVSSSEEDPSRWSEHVISAIDEALRERFHSPEGTRGRLTSAMIEMLRESESFEAIRIGKLVRRAHVPTGDFYRQFAGKRECFAVAYGALLDDLLAEVRSDPARDSAQPRTSVPAFLESLGSALTADPIRLRLLVVEAAHLPDLPSDEMAGAWRGSLAASLAELLAECEGTDAGDPRLPFIAGSLIEAIRSAVVSHQVGRLKQRLASVGEGLGVSSPRARPLSRLAA